jgi:tetratricopeptide (TPR) repeat protein
MADLRIAILTAVSKKWDEIDVGLTGGIRGEAIPTLMSLRQEIGKAFMELDKLEDADREFASLYTMSAERIALKGRNDSTRTNHAKIAFVRAPVVKRLGRDPAAALQLLKEAESLVRECLTDPQPQPKAPTPTEIKELLSAILQNLGIHYLEQGQLATAESLFSEALNTIADVLKSVREAPDFEGLSQDLKDQRTAERQINHDKLALGLAYISIRLGKTDPALALYDKAIAGRREIYERRKTMSVLKSELASHLSNYAQSLLWIGQLEKLSPIIQEAVTLSEELHSADPQQADYTRRLTAALYTMATLRDLQAHTPEADSLFERCRLLRQQLADKSPDEKNRINLMLAAARCRQTDQARKLIDELGEATTKNAELHLERARALAQLARHAADDTRTELLNLALTALERAAEEGYGDPFRINAEPDLAPLKSEPRFIAVVEKVKERSK